MKMIAFGTLGLAMMVGHTFANDSVDYAKVRGWEIVQNNNGCVALHPSRRDILWSIDVAPAGGWQISIDDLAGHPDGKEFPARLTIGNDSFSEDYVSYQGAFVGSLPLSQRLALAKGSEISIQIDNMQLDFSLSGSTAAMLKLEECWHKMTGFDPAISSRRGSYAFK